MRCVTIQDQVVLRSVAQSPPGHASGDRAHHLLQCIQAVSRDVSYGVSNSRRIADMEYRDTYLKTLAQDFADHPAISDTKQVRCYVFFAYSCRTSIVYRTWAVLTTLRASLCYVPYVLVIAPSIRYPPSVKERPRRSSFRKPPPLARYTALREFRKVEERTIELTSDVASHSSVPFSGGLSSRERSRSFGIVIGGGVTREVGVGIRRAERIVIELSG
jgi:hypothetical protein